MRLWRNWGVHNIIAHPLMQICIWLGLHQLGAKIHDGTLPEPELENGR
jgi:hypothetical protein